MTPIKNNRYFLSQLSGGDRFYFVGNRQKKIYTLESDNTFETRKQVGFWIKYARCRADGGEIELHKANRYVIFLRNINHKL